MRHKYLNLKLPHWVLKMRGQALSKLLIEKHEEILKNLGCDLRHFYCGTRSGNRTNRLWVFSDLIRVITNRRVSNHNCPGIGQKKYHNI